MVPQSHKLIVIFGLMVILAIVMARVGVIPGQRDLRILQDLYKSELPASPADSKRESTGRPGAAVTLHKESPKQ